MTIRLHQIVPGVRAVEAADRRGIDLAISVCRALSMASGRSVLGDRDRSAFKRASEVLALAYDEASALAPGGESDGEGKAE